MSRPLPQGYQFRPIYGRFLDLLFEGERIESAYVGAYPHRWTVRRAERRLRRVARYHARYGVTER